MGGTLHAWYLMVCLYHPSSFTDVFVVTCHRWADGHGREYLEFSFGNSAVLKLCPGSDHLSVSVAASSCFKCCILLSLSPYLLRTMRINLGSRSLNNYIYIYISQECWDCLHGGNRVANFANCTSTLWMNHPEKFAWEVQDVSWLKVWVMTTKVTAVWRAFNSSIQRIYWTCLQQSTADGLFQHFFFAIPRFKIIKSCFPFSIFDY